MFFLVYGLYLEGAFGNQAKTADSKIHKLLAEVQK
jgi:hypothetical protein